MTRGVRQTAPRRCSMRSRFSMGASSALRSTSSTTPAACSSSTNATCAHTALVLSPQVFDMCRPLYVHSITLMLYGCLQRLALRASFVSQSDVLLLMQQEQINHLAIWS